MENYTDLKVEFTISLSLWIWEKRTICKRGGPSDGKLGEGGWESFGVLSTYSICPSISPIYLSISKLGERGLDGNCSRGKPYILRDLLISWASFKFIGNY